MKIACLNRCRGEIKVKGKGNMITYFLMDPSHHNSQYNGNRDYRGNNNNQIENIEMS